MLDPAILKNDIESLELNLERRNLDVDLKELTALDLSLIHISEPTRPY